MFSMKQRKLSSVESPINASLNKTLTRLQYKAGETPCENTLFKKIPINQYELERTGFKMIIVSKVSVSNNGV